MKKVKLESNEIELALNVAAKRFIGNVKMGKGFSYGYQGDYKKQLGDSFLGALGEVAYAKSSNSFYNGSYTDNLKDITTQTFKIILKLDAKKRKIIIFF